MEIESVGELLYACKENRLKLYKGFGEKTQQNVIDTIEFYFKNKGSHLYAQVSLIAPHIKSFIEKIFPAKQIAITGNFKRQTEIIDELELLVEATEKEIETAMLDVDGFTLKEKTATGFIFSTSAGVDVKLHWTDISNFTERLIQTSSSDSFNDVFFKTTITNPIINATDEETYFKEAGITFVPASLRDNPEIIEIAKKGQLPDIIRPSDIKGIIHCHSNWSDGSHTIEQMARSCYGKRA